MSDKSTGLSSARSINSVMVPLVISTFFALGTLFVLLAALELQRVRDAFGITDNFLERFPHNLLIKIQWLMFLIGAFYLLVRAPFVRRSHAALKAQVENVGPSERLHAFIARGEQAENAGLAPLSFIVWVLPILGFLGTVVGVSNSMGPLEALAKGEAAAKVAPELLRNLRYPFDATFTGLVLLLPMMIAFTAAATRAKRRIVGLREHALGLDIK